MFTFSPSTFSQKQQEKQNKRYPFLNRVLDSKLVPLKCLTPQESLNRKRRHNFPTVLVRTNDRPSLRLDLRINISCQALKAERMVFSHMQRAPQLQRLDRGTRRRSLFEFLFPTLTTALPSKQGTETTTLTGACACALVTRVTAKDVNRSLTDLWEA
jgi:hypothetical protein